MSEWREYWTAEECAEMRDVLTPQQFEEEFSRRRAKMEHYRVAEAFGLSVEEAALMRVRGLMALGESGGTA